MFLFFKAPNLSNGFQLDIWPLEEPETKLSQ